MMRAGIVWRVRAILYSAIRIKSYYEGVLEMKVEIRFGGLFGIFGVNIDLFFFGSNREMLVFFSLRLSKKSFFFGFIY